MYAYCLLGLIKKFNMDIAVKIERFQIKQNVLILKSTLAGMGKFSVVCVSIFKRFRKCCFDF